MDNGITREIMFPLSIVFRRSATPGPGASWLKSIVSITKWFRRTSDVAIKPNNAIYTKARRDSKGDGSNFLSMLGNVRPTNHVDFIWLFVGRLLFDYATAGSEWPSGGVGNALTKPGESKRSAGGLSSSTLGGRASSCVSSRF